MHGGGGGGCRGWVGLGWVGLSWVGLGWVGLGWVGLSLGLRLRRCPTACVTLPHRHHWVPTFGCLVSQPPRLLTIPKPHQGAGEMEILPCLCLSVARTLGWFRAQLHGAQEHGRGQRCNF